MTALSSDALVRFGPDGPVRVDASVRLTGDSSINCHVYDDSAPILSVYDAHICVSFGARDPKQVTGQDVTQARRLAAAVAEWVAVLERLAAAEDTGPDDAAVRAA